MSNRSSGNLAAGSGSPKNIDLVLYVVLLNYFLYNFSQEHDRDLEPSAFDRPDQRASYDIEHVPAL